MATSLQTIRRMTIESRTVGVDETSQKLVRLGQAQDSVSAASERASKQSTAYERALESQSRALEMTVRLNAEMARDRAALSAQLMQQTQAANDNNRSLSANGLEWAEWANHVKAAGGAAYAFSPAFRGVVDELTAPVLRASLTATTAIVAGMVTATNLAGRGLIEVGVAASRSSTALAPFGSQVALAGAAMAGFNPSIVGVASSIVSRLMPALRLLGAIGLVVHAARMIGDAWELSGKQLDEYRQIAERAAKVDLSTEFFQRISKAATDAKMPVDDLTAAMKRLSDVSADKLGGSEGGNRLNDLTKAGNFAGNTGVGQFTGAGTTEEKFRAIVSLIDQAMQKGERLAALDVSKTFLGDAATAALAKDSDYLNKMLASADKIAATELISNADVGNALALQTRIDAAEKILSQRWHPIQNILVGLGLKMREGWVNILEAIAESFNWLGKFIERLSNIPQSLVDRFVNLTTTPESRAAAAAQYGVVTDKNDPQWQMDIAKQKLTSGLNNPANVFRARDEANAVERAFFKDTSRDPGAKKIAEVKDAYDRAEESLLKYIETTKAAAASTGEGVEQQERLKAIAQLTAAGMKDGLTPEAAKAKAEMSGLAEEAAQAALALAKAKIASDIKFGRSTAFLSQEDVQIAQQLKSIYPDVATALESVEAKGIRANNAFREITSTVESALTSGLTDIAMGTKSVSQGFSDMASAFARAVEQMVIKIMIVEPLLRSLQGLMSSGLGGLGLGLTGGGSIFTGQDAALNASLFPGYGTGIGANARGTNSWRGGLTRVNEEGGEIMDLPQGTRIIPHDVSMAMAAGNDNRAPTFNLYLIEDSSRAGQTQQSTNGDGGMDITAFVDSITAKNAGNPGSATSQVLDQRKRVARR